MSTQDKIALFFEDPKVYKAPPNDYGTLYLLRREISMCLGIDPSTQEPKSHSVLWSGVIDILIGIDLLGKFFAGSDESGRGEVGKRFKVFYTRYFDFENAEIIYQLRNALLHSFALHSGHYRFSLSEKDNDRIVEKLVEPDKRHRIYLIPLWQGFENAVEQYHRDLENQKDCPDLLANFERMFEKYGLAIFTNEPKS